MPPRLHRPAQNLGRLREFHLHTEAVFNYIRGNLSTITNMKDLFPGYCKPSEDEIKKIWDEAIFYFDANVLLNLYRYSEDTQEAILNLINKLKNRVCLPHQAGLEYHRNRYETIIGLSDDYKEFIKQVEAINTTLASTKRHPFLSEKVNKSLEKGLKQAKEEAKENIDKYSNFMKGDPLYQKLSGIFNEDTITKQYEQKRLEVIYKEGEERYKKVIPPGFRDAKKPDNSKYGDLVLWNQIIDHAKTTKKPVIFITDDGKKDWWWIAKGDRTIGPRQELVEEMKNKAQTDLLMYSSISFLKYGNSYFDVEVKEDVFDEIVKNAAPISQLNIGNSVQSNVDYPSIFSLQGRFHHYIKEISGSEKRIKQCEHDLLELDKSQEDMAIKLMMRSNFTSIIESLKSKRTLYIQKLEEMYENLSYNDNPNLADNILRYLTSLKHKNI